MVRPHKLPKKSGLSLIEVLVAIVVLAWVLAMNARMTETTIVSNQYVRWSSASSEIASAKAEQLRRAGYEQLARDEYEVTEARDGTRFRVTASVRDSEMPGLAELEIAVKWEKGTRIGGAQTYHTLLRKK